LRRNTVRIGILVFDDVEELDFVGPLEVFGIAARIAGDLDLVTLSKNGKSIRARYGLRVQPDQSLATCPPLDLLLVPGGKGAREVVRYDADILSFIRAHARRAETASVCSGALVLAEAGVLAGRRATTHWSELDGLRQYPDVTVQEHVRFVRDGTVATSAGVSAGIDLALDIVREKYGNETAREVAHVMEYPYDTPKEGRGRSPVSGESAGGGRTRRGRRPPGG
jgi:transcriptional regulator GlxA family with amidase domain